MSIPATAILSLQGQPSMNLELSERAARLAKELQLPLLEDSDSCPAEYEFLLGVTESGLELSLNRGSAPGPVRVDFDNPTLDYRVNNRVGRQAIARAVGVKPGLLPTVLDGTAGLGKDAYLLACTGCRVWMLEQNPVIHALLADGLRRGRLSGDDRTVSAVSRLKLSLVSLCDFEPPANGFDVVYLDPMFPKRNKSARVKKDMYVLQQFFSVTARAEGEDMLLRRGIDIARRRVVVKRPARAPDMGGRVPTFRLQGKSSRYDIYVTG